jgi:exosortase A-associated hydrolase 2
VTAPFEPLFIDALPGPLGRRFAVHHRPRDGAPRGLVLYVHPFAEEMNKSRRMAALQARALAAAGFAVLQIDLLGCGDSAGDFGDATWAQWVDDVVCAARWLRQRHGGRATTGDRMPPLWLWGLRCGALLASEAAWRLDAPCHFLLWQPATSGKTVLQQFLRLKAASELLSGQARGVTEQLRAELAAGRTVEVAGYRLHPELCRGLEQTVLRPPSEPGRMVWLELQPREGAALSPLAANAVAAWQAAGWAARAEVVTGPAFWQTTEIEDAPALLAATLAALDDAGHATDPIPPPMPAATLERMQA